MGNPSLMQNIPLFFPIQYLFVRSSDSFLAELFRGMLFKWKGANKKSHQK